MEVVQCFCVHYIQEVRNSVDKWGTVDVLYSIRWYCTVYDFKGVDEENYCTVYVQVNAKY